MWCVMGGFLLHILECNYLTVLIKPVYEKPIDTAEDILERGLKIIDTPGTQDKIDPLKQSSSQLIRTIAVNTIIAEASLLMVPLYTD